MRSKLYYKDINLLRVLSCIAVLLYHFNLLKGGYLAVCVFFVLSGYLSCVSAFRKKKFSLKDYYLNKLQKLYLPLILVVFITIAITKLIPDLLWLNLKPETTSVLAGYNNFWQLNANLDYFARHINSPFIHLWYISILLQFDLVFPLICLTLKKIGDKINKIIPCYLTVILSIVFSIYFYKASLDSNIMTVYYDTFARIFSLLFGVSLGFIQYYCGSLLSKKPKTSKSNKLVFMAYLIILLILFIFIDAQSKFFAGSMIISSLITCRLITYGAISIDGKLSIFDKIIKSIADISYGIYLVQYPVIFFFQFIELNIFIEFPLMIILIVILSYVLKLCTSFKEKSIYVKIMRLLIYAITLYGLVEFCIAKDHTDEMKMLEEQLDKNEEIIAQKQKEYEAKAKQENDNWLATITELENGEEALKDVVSELSIVGIGDSVMLGAVQNLYAKFPNGYFNAQVSRTAWVAKGLLLDLKKRNLLGDPIVFNLGANGDCSDACKNELVKIIGDRDIFWINVTNDKEVRVNKKLDLLASKYQNVHIIDWKTISNGHPEYFISDKLHLTKKGREAYTNAIYDEIYKVYLARYQAEKEEIIKKYEEEQKSKKSFYGNDLLANSFEYLQNDFTGAEFVINKFTYESLKEEITNAITNNTLNYNVIFAFDNSFSINALQYKELIDICKDHKIYILLLNDKLIPELSNLNYENLEIINFYEEVQKNNYLMFDKIHLTKEGSKALSEILVNTIK